MTNEEQEAEKLLLTYGERSSDVADDIIRALQFVQSCKDVVEIHIEFWLKVKEIVLNCSSSNLADYKEELMLVVGYIMSQDLLNGTFFNTYDKAVKIAKKFLEKYPPSKDDWGVNEEWDETVEKFVKNIID